MADKNQFLDKEGLKVVVDAINNKTTTKHAKTDKIITNLEIVEVEPEEIIESFGGKVLPDGGKPGQVVTKTTDGVEWKDNTVELPSFKSVNGESIIGEGDITIEVDNVNLSNYYTKTQADDKFEPKLPAGSEGQVLAKTASGAEWKDPFTKSQADEFYQPVGDYATKGDLNAKAAEFTVGEGLEMTGDRVLNVELTDYATKDDIAGFIDDAKYNDGTQKIEFYHGASVVARLDATPFIIDNFVKDAKVVGTDLVISFNTADKTDIKVPLSDIFDPSNYYTISQVEQRFNEELYEGSDSSKTPKYLTKTEATITYEPKLPTGSEGQVLTKTNGGVEWKDNTVELPPFKSVNGESIIGEGDITIEVDNVNLSNYYTKIQADDKFEHKLPEGTPGQVLTKTEEGAEWKDPTGGGSVELPSFKTINGEEIIGDGDITIEVELPNYVEITAEDVKSMFN